MFHVQNKRNGCAEFSSLIFFTSSFKLEFAHDEKHCGYVLMKSYDKFMYLLMETLVCEMVAVALMTGR